MKKAQQSKCVAFVRNVGEYQHGEYQLHLHSFYDALFNYLIMILHKFDSTAKFFNFNKI